MSQERKERRRQLAHCYKMLAAIARAEGRDLQSAGELDDYYLELTLRQVIVASGERLPSGNYPAMVDLSRIRCIGNLDECRRVLMGGEP